MVAPWRAVTREQGESQNGYPDKSRHEARPTGNTDQLKQAAAVMFNKSNFSSSLVDEQKAPLCSEDFPPAGFRTPRNRRFCHQETFPACATYERRDCRQAISADTASSAPDSIAEPGKTGYPVYGYFISAKG